MRITSLFRKKPFLGVATLVGAVFVALQFIRPELTNPPERADRRLPVNVKPILQNSCYDCHSNETRLAWFDHVVPAVWLVADDVHKARAKLNFSHFDDLPPAQQSGVLFEALNHIEQQEMPLRRYTRFHPSAVVSARQVATFRETLAKANPAKATDTEQTEAANRDVDKWLRGEFKTSAVRPTANGVEFLPDYKNWKVISATDRWDNRSLRVVLGNDVAISAIEMGHTNPWPDGAILAKPAWSLLEDESGHVQPEKFLQVEFMIKDGAKYASTLGWGWGRWRGTDLEPYGKDASFTAECMGCHAPMRENDFVFTLPVVFPKSSDRRSQAEVINAEASLPGQTDTLAGQGRVITSTVDRQSATMSILFGNDLAIDHARSTSGGNYSAGSRLTLVTWREQDDEHWFGARIPGSVDSVESVHAESAQGDESTTYRYERYEGTPLARNREESAEASAPRIEMLKSQRAAVMP